jgi:hypothetical protein
MTIIKINNYEKLQKRVDEITTLLEGDWSKIDTNALMTERADKQFILNKRGVNVRLTGNNKYFWGYQFDAFRKNISKYGCEHNKDIDGNKISFHKYSINEDYSQYSNDLYRFESVEEMKGFVKGFNSLCYVLENKKLKKVA